MYSKNHSVIRFPGVPSAFPPSGALVAGMAQSDDEKAGAMIDTYATSERCIG